MTLNRIKSNDKEFSGKKGDCIKMSWKDEYAAK